MLELVHAMFFAPKAQADAYSWGAVLLAHAAIGAILTAAMGAVAAAVRASFGAWRAALWASLLYLVFWEGGQLLLAGAEMSDSLLDALAVSLGAVAAAAAWRQCRATLLAAIAIFSVVGIRGIRRRSRREP